MAAAGGLVRSKLLRLQGAGVGALAGFFSAAAVASASASASASGGGDGSNACPAYPWPPQDGARGGAKVFMQHDCAACHSMLPYAGAGAGAGLAAAGAGGVGATAAEIVVVHEVAQPEPAAAAAAAPHGGACPPDLSVVAKMLEGLRRRSNPYTADELKRTTALPTPVWLQFLQPYLRKPHAA